MGVEGSPRVNPLMQNPESMPFYYHIQEQTTSLTSGRRKKGAGGKKSEVSDHVETRTAKISKPKLLKKYFEFE